MYKISFNYKGSEVKFENRIARSLYSQILDWLYDNGYGFTGSLHTTFLRKPHSLVEVNKAILDRGYTKDDFIQVKDLDLYFYRCGNISKIYPNIILMLKNFGIDDTQIKSEGLGNLVIPRFRAKLVDDMGGSDTNIDADVSDGDDIESDEVEDFKIQKFSQFGMPTDYKSVQSQEENEPAVRNPFGGESRESGDEFNSSALFVVGTSGAGKSTRILSLLRKNGHRLILIGAENAPSPNLLLDYDQNEGYVPSDIAEFIISAKNDPTHFYTIVFDECHEYIDEIKRSILHAISTKRGEKRFFGVRKSVRNFFEDLDTYESTSKVIPDNVGFIFISSKPDVFEYHADFMGRVDKVEVKREDPYPYPDLKYIQSKIDRQDQL